MTWPFAALTIQIGIQQPTYQTIKSQLLVKFCFDAGLNFSNEWHKKYNFIWQLHLVRMSQSAFKAKAHAGMCVCVCVLANKKNEAFRS